MVGASGRRVLLTVSGSMPVDLHEAIAAGRRPRADYLELAQRFDADLLDHPGSMAPAGRIGRLLGRLAGANVVLAVACFRLRRRYDVVVTDGEQVGLPLAGLLLVARRKRPRHVMIVHVMSVRAKVALHRALRLGRRIDLMVVYATRQRELVGSLLGRPPEATVLSTFMVDTDFFRPAAVEAHPSRMICAAGLELRDYRTLIDAVRGLDVKVVIAAGSPWSTRRDTVGDEEMPTNVEVCRLDFVALRQLYADACFVVVPLQDVDFQAGITTILEGMAMGKAVICSRTRGQTDTIVDECSGVYVPPGDVMALRAAIERLLDRPELAAGLGAAGRRWVVEHADVRVYAERLGRHVDQLRETTA